jgi:hypothetical protein
MANPVPSTFAPLASSNPVPADTEAMTNLGQQYTTTANTIAQQASNLQQLSNDSSDAWVSKAGSKFTSKASDLATRITQAEQRYTTAGAALTAAAEPMYQAQQQAYAAVQQAQEAEQTMTANAPSPPPAAGSPPLTADQKAAAATAASNYSAASDSLASAQASFNSAVDAYDTAAKNCANTINAELDHDALKDTWFQQHFGWLLEFLKILTIIAMALAAIALILACPFSAGLIVGLGVAASTVASAATIVGLAGLAVTVLSTVGDAMAAGGGLEGWTSFITDLVGLATFGLGEGIAAAGKVAATDAENLAKGFASNAAKGAVTDAAKTAASDAAKNSALDAAADKAAAAAEKGFTDNATAAGVLTPDQITAGAKSAGEEAALNATIDESAVGQAAVDALLKSAGDTGKASITTAVENAEKGLTNSPLSNFIGATNMSSDIAEAIAKVNAIQKTVPNFAKIGQIANEVTTGAVVNGGIQTGMFGYGIYSTYGAVTS